jgi:hypothetical protein
MDNLIQEISIARDHLRDTLNVLQEALSRPEKSVVELSAIGAC